MKENSFLKLMLLAIEFCLTNHSQNPTDEAHSVRKWDGKTPYGVHPIGSGMILLQETKLPSSVNRENCALALFFHDIKEDTTVELPGWLSSEVVDLIKLMTLDPEKNSIDEEMKIIWDLPPIIRLLKLYDKTSNLLDGSWMSDEKWNNQYVPYVLKLVDDVENNYGSLNIINIARAVAKPRV